MTPGQQFCIVLIVFFAISFYFTANMGTKMLPGIAMLYGVGILGSACGVAAKVIYEVLRGS